MVNDSSSPEEGIESIDDCAVKPNAKHNKSSGSTSFTKSVDYRLLLASFLKKHDSNLLPQLKKMLDTYGGKEPKLCLRLAKKFDASNPLNRVFVSLVTDEHFTDYLKLTTLYLSIFYPQDVEEAAALCMNYVGKESELFRKLSSNFRAINPLTMDRGMICNVVAQPVDYSALLTEFYQNHDPEQAAEVEEVLSKCVGKEAILFSVIASKYNTSNALNAVFHERLTSVQPKDCLSMLKLYLSVFHPLCVSDAKLMLEHYTGKESELFSRLATKFRACNPLEICGDIGSGFPTTIEKDGCISLARPCSPCLAVSQIRPAATPKSNRQSRILSQSPAVTP